jgi:hypothetical protein
MSAGLEIVGAGGEPRAVSLTSRNLAMSDAYSERHDLGGEASIIAVLNQFGDLKPIFDSAIY